MNRPQAVCFICVTLFARSNAHSIHSLFSMVQQLIKFAPSSKESRSFTACVGWVTEHQPLDWRLHAPAIESRTKIDYYYELDAGGSAV